MKEKPVLSTFPVLIEPSSQSATLVSTLLIPDATPPYQWPASSASTGVEHWRQAASTGHRVCELLCIGSTSLGVGLPMRSPRAAAARATPHCAASAAAAAGSARGGGR